jgi:hypothetical protein
LLVAVELEVRMVLLDLVEVVVEALGQQDHLRQLMPLMEFMPPEEVVVVERVLILEVK